MELVFCRSYVTVRMNGDDNHKRNSIFVCVLQNIGMRRWCVKRTRLCAYGSTKAVFSMLGGKNDNLLLQFAIILLNSFYVFINLNFLLLCDLLEYICANQDERVFLLHFIDFSIVRCNCARKVLAVECILHLFMVGCMLLRSLMLADCFQYRRAR